MTDSRIPGKSCALTFLSAWRKGRISVKASASENEVHEGLPSGGIGLGRRSPSQQRQKRLNRCQSSRVIFGRVNPPGRMWDTSGAGQSNCRCGTLRMDAAKPAAFGSSESQAAKARRSRYAVACGETQSKPICRQPGTIPKSAASRDRACPKLWL